jgi:succinylglutamate desuccinylase
MKISRTKRDSSLKFGFIRKIRRRETKRIIDTSAQQYDEMKQLHNISKEIEKYIDNDNIDKKIDKNVHDFMEFKYLEIMQKRNGNKAKSTI